MDDYLDELDRATASNRAIQMPDPPAPVPIPAGIMGSMARQDDYAQPDDAFAAAAARLRGPYRNIDPNRSNLPAIGQGLINSTVSAVATPGQLMAPNPYPPGTEEADAYEGYRQGAMVPWASNMALNAMGTGGIVGVPVKGAEAVLAAGAGRKVPTAPGSVLGPATAEIANPRLRAKAEGLFGKYPQYAEAYPEIGPPELMSKLPDPKNPGKFLSKPDKPVPYTTMEEALALDAQPGYFLEKKLAPEVEQFQKDRNLIQQEMDLHGYQPFFDPAKRFDVNPKNYGPFEDTAITAAPKTAKTQAEWSAKYGTDEIRARLRAGFERGLAVPESDRWYYMGQLEKQYINELGVKEGRDAFRREFADMMAATTGGASPYDNFLMSHYANVMNKAGERLPERSYNLPFPIGGRFASGNIAQAQKYIDQGNAAWPVGNPKRYDFSSAYLGNRNAGTIDEQMMTAFDPTLKNKQPVWYGPATQTLREEAAKAGVDTRGFQDVGWAGLKGLKEEAAGKKFEYEGPMINQINRSIETTHRLTGMPRDEIVRRGLIRKEIPMYTMGGQPVPVMGGLAAQDNYQ